VTAQTAPAPAPRASRPEIVAAPALPRRRAVAALPLAVLLAAASALLSLAVGSRTIPPLDVLRVLLAADGSDASVVVRELRLPRTALGLVVGAALGVAGAQLQALTRNPLADPGLLGVSAGAAFGVVATSTVLGVGGAAGQAGAALLGALGATLAVALLAGPPRVGSSPLTLVLSGVAISAVLASLTSVLVLLDAETLDEYRFWAVGALAGRDPSLLLSVAPLLLAGLLLAVLTCRSLDLLALGDDLARGLGARLGAVRAGVLLSATLLTAAAVAVTGPLVFVGLVVPHLARGVVGARHGLLLPLCALLGAALLLAADVVGRVVARPAEVQVGIVVALVGAPFLLALVRRTVPA
jgi:iron complex transport system permease protein